jgi:PST family polysaccharide transporter
MVRLILQIGSTVILARLIAPEEYGLVGMVLALIGIGDALLNLGLHRRLSSGVTSTPCR